MNTTKKNTNFYCEKLVIQDHSKFRLHSDKSKEIDTAIVELIKSKNDFFPLFQKISPSRQNENSYMGNFYHDEDKEFTFLNLNSNIYREGFNIFLSCQAQIDYIGDEELPDYAALNDYTIDCMKIIQGLL